MSIRLSPLGLVVVALVAVQNTSSQIQSMPESFTQLVDKEGNLRRPKEFGDLYQFLGTFMVLDAKANEMHVTYASPGTADAYRRTGTFPDGAVLVKEVLETEHQRMTTGDVHYAAKSKVWFVMIKDDKGRYPNSPLWGNGWGWALFNADAPERQVATDYKKDCLGCHIPAKATDWVYIKGYPALATQSFAPR